MKVSFAIHKLEPDMDGNQRDGEAAYGGYNRQYLDLTVDPNTGGGMCEGFNILFPNINTDPETFRFVSIARCFAPEGFGGAIIIAGALAEPIVGHVGHSPQIKVFGCAVEPERMKALHLVVQERTGAWREKSEAELRADMAGVR